MIVEFAFVLLKICEIFQNIKRIFFQICGDKMKSIDQQLKGCQLRLQSKCFSGHTSLWQSSADIGQMAEVNLCSAAILFSGSTFTEISGFFRALECQFISRSTYYKNQAHYLIPAISKFYKEEQDRITAELAEQSSSVTVMGDERYVI